MRLTKLSPKALLAAEYLKEKGGIVTESRENRLSAVIRAGISELIEREMCTWYIEDNGNIRYEFE